MNVKRVVPSVLTTALVAGMTIAGSPVSAADQSAKMTEVLTIQDTGWSSERSETLALNLGQLLVSRIARAKQLVDRGDLSKAQLAILDAESTADVIVNISPVIRVTDKITDMNNKVLVDDTESFADTLIPINGYVDEMEIFAPKLATATRKSERCTGKGGGERCQGGGEDHAGGCRRLGFDHLLFAGTACL